MAPSDLDRVNEGIKRTGVHLTGLEADDHRSGISLERGRERCDLEPALAVTGHLRQRPDQATAFWPHTLVSQSAPKAAGSSPPITKPKNLPPAIPVVPGSASRARSSMTSTGVGAAGRQVTAEGIQHLLVAGPWPDRPGVESLEESGGEVMRPNQCPVPIIHGGRSSHPWQPVIP
jgi:hypothetical protein